MRGRAGWAAGLAMYAASLGAVAATVSDGGGRDLSVALFSARLVRSATLTPVGADPWVAKCERCAREPLHGPLHVAGSMEVFAGGTLRVTDDASEDARTAAGLWHLRGRDGGIDVVLTLPSERYVAAVLNAEAAADEPSQSLRAMAILARTYALNGRHFVARPGHLTAELCDSTACQAITPASVSQASEDAARDTAGETLWFGSHRAEVFFSQNCGGVTEDAGALWRGVSGVPYLRSHADPYCTRHGAVAWHAEVPLAKFAEIARAEGWRVPANIVFARVMQRSVSHRALRVLFEGASGTTGIVSASALRFGIGRAMGWNHVRSDAYDMGVHNGALVFDGHGHGHGVGLCQEGAAEMATEGKSAREILAFYFPGTAVRILPGDQGWRERRAGALTLRTTQPLPATRMSLLDETWREAQKRFPPHHPIAPEIVFAPSTEVFRQMTMQPGWALASTRGNTIVLQPEDVLRAHGREASATLLHEMLHVLVEAEASGEAPLWLREGLVEVLAGESGTGAEAMTPHRIDKRLQRADSLRASERAHLAASARVRGLIARYGVSTLRGWLASGVPAGVE